MTVPSLLIRSSIMDQILVSTYVQDHAQEHKCLVAPPSCTSLRPLISLVSVSVLNAAHLEPSVYEVALVKR